MPRSDRRSLRFDEREILLLLHGLKGPLNSLLWTLREFDPAEPGEARTVVRCREKAALLESRLALLSAALFARREGAPPPTEFDPRVLMALFAPDGEKTTPRRELSMPSDLPPRLAGHPEILRFLVETLLENALHYAGTEAVIRIALNRERKPGMWRITVQDDGPGIEPALRSRLGKPFLRSERGRELNPGGWGLGLWIARTVARTHGISLRFRAGRPKGLAVGLSWSSDPPSEAGSAS